MKINDITRNCLTYFGPPSLDAKGTHKSSQPPPSRAAPSPITENAPQKDRTDTGLF
jgi:hypothetical protein